MHFTSGISMTILGTARVLHGGSISFVNNSLILNLV